MAAIDFPLLTYFAFWQVTSSLLGGRDRELRKNIVEVNKILDYLSTISRYLGNYYYNIQNKNAANASGGSDFAMTISTAQLAIGVVYAVFLWIAPDARKPPTITTADFFKMIPAGVCSAGAHAASVFALAAGGVAFGQIVKAAEPAFAAVIGTFVYGKKISAYKWMCLIPIIGGVCLAALKQVSFLRN